VHTTHVLEVGLDGMRHDGEAVGKMYVVFVRSGSLGLLAVVLL